MPKTTGINPSATAGLLSLLISKNSSTVSTTDFLLSKAAAGNKETGCFKKF